MKLRLWRTLAFALLAAGLGAYLWWVERPRMLAEAEPDRLVEIEADDVARVRLAYPGPPPLVLTLALEDGDWRLVEPLAADADDEVVKRLVEQVAEAKAERRIAAGEAQPLATYGLEGDGTQARVSMTRRDGTALPDVVLGDTTPVGYKAFARVEGNDDVVVVPLLVHSGVKKSVFDVREKTLFDIQPADALSAKLVRGTETVALTRDGDAWKMTEPVRDTADREQVLTLLRSLNEVDAIEFFDTADVDRAKFGLDAPTIAFEAELGGGENAGLRIGAKSTEAPDGWYAERVSDGQVVKVPEWVKVRFDQSASTLRDKRLFACEAGDIATVRFDRGDGETFALVREGEHGWRMEPPAERPLKTDVVQRSVSGLAALAGKEIVAEDTAGPGELARFGLDAPVAEVEALREDGTSCGRARAGAVGSDTDAPAYYVRRSDGGAVMSVPAYLYSRFDMRRSDFLEPGPELAPAEAPARGLEDREPASGAAEEGSVLDAPETEPHPRSPPGTQPRGD